MQEIVKNNLTQEILEKIGVDKDLQDALNQVNSFEKSEKIILKLSKALKKYYGARLVLLIDQYNQPIQHAPLVSPLQKMIVDTFRRFFGAALKNNSNLKYAFITGVQRISKESFFPD